jgi:hypothetical protein
MQHPVLLRQLDVERQLDLDRPMFDARQLRADGRHRRLTLKTLPDPLPEIAAIFANHLPPFRKRESGMRVAFRQAQWS